LIIVHFLNCADIYTRVDTKALYFDIGPALRQKSHKILDIKLYTVLDSRLDNALDMTMGIQLDLHPCINR